MARIATALLALVLAGCDLLPKQPRKMAQPADTVTPPLPGIRMDTMSDKAAAESAKVFARTQPAQPSPFAVHISGAAHYSADSGVRITCVSSESEGEQLLQVEAYGRDLHLGFTVYNGKDGKVPVGNIYTRRRAKSRIGNLQVTVRGHDYADGTGHAQITDPIGRSGTISASNFVKMGVKKHESHRANLSVSLRWSCE